MNNLPEPIVDNIFKYKHQLEFKHVMDELTNNYDNLYFSTKRELIRYLQDNINSIDCVISENHNRISILYYLKIICRSRNKIFN